METVTLQPGNKFCDWSRLIEWLATENRHSVMLILSCNNLVDY
jgi:hypothetical protein